MRIARLAFVTIVAAVGVQACQRADPAIARGAAPVAAAAARDDDVREAALRYLMAHSTLPGADLDACVRFEDDLGSFDPSRAFVARFHGLPAVVPDAADCEPGEHDHEIVVKGSHRSVSLFVLWGLTWIDSDHAQVETGVLFNGVGGGARYTLERRGGAWVVIRLDEGWEA